MDDKPRQVKFSSKISVESRKSSGCRSLERPSWRSRDVSLSKRQSLIQYMSLESSRKSEVDIYDKLLSDVNQENRMSAGVIRSGIMMSISNDLTIEIGLEKKKSDENKTELTHVCLCYQDCFLQGCPCFNATQQFCKKGLCCIKCIEIKNEMMKNKAPTQQKQTQNLFCTCKKTRCNKKYCSCFAAGIKCGKQCSCQNCINCDRVSNHEMDVEESGCYIGEEELAKMELPEKMDFEPVEFRYSNNN